MQDLIMGAITDYGVEDIEMWVNSLKQSGYTGKIAMLVYNSTDEVVEYLQNNDIDVIMVGKPAQSTRYDYFYKDRSEFNICVDRFFHYWKYLKKQYDLRFIILTDVKDVVFQTNPIHALEEAWYGLEKGIIPSAFLTSENLRYQDEPWGLNNLTLSFPEKVDELRDKGIVNAGVLAGLFGKKFFDFLYSVFALSRYTGLTHVPGGGGPDQAALNVLVNMSAWKDHVFIFEASDSYACQAGTTNDPAKIEQFRDKWLTSFVPYLNTTPENKWWFRNKIGVIASDNNLVSIVHQYDRIPEWKKYFEDKFRKVN